MRNQTQILIAGVHLRQHEKMLRAFRENGFELLFAADVQEALRLARRKHPNLIISNFSLPGGSGLDFCRMIRRDTNLSATAFVFFSENQHQSESIYEALRVGADDCFAEFFTPQFLVAKAAWLIKRKSSEEALNQHYQILRQNQTQILTLIKQTFDLLDNMNHRHKVEKPEGAPGQEFEFFLNNRLDLGLDMISALANLVDDQARALDIRESSLRSEPAIDQEIINQTNLPCYDEISCN